MYVGGGGGAPTSTTTGAATAGCAAWLFLFIEAKVKPQKQQAMMRPAGITQKQMTQVMITA